jgi:hypothetical protein
MKKLKLILLLMGMISCSAFAQNRASQSPPNAAVASTTQVKMDAIKSCGDLQNQLVTLFGEAFSLSDSKVLDQLNRNINDQNASVCIRKSSLYAIYGDDYVKHLNRIAPKASSTHNKQ